MTCKHEILLYNAGEKNDGDCKCHFCNTVFSIEHQKTLNNKCKLMVYNINTNTKIVLEKIRSIIETNDLGINTLSYLKMHEFDIYGASINAKVSHSYHKKV